MAIMLPSRESAPPTYSPFLPSSKDWRQDAVPIENRCGGHALRRDPDTKEIETPVTGGSRKLQWKPDWAMRWYAGSRSTTRWLARI
jgi:lysyl-tRNA synthetase class 1